MSAGLILAVMRCTAIPEGRQGNTIGDNGRGKDDDERATAYRREESSHSLRRAEEPDVIQSEVCQHYKGHSSAS